MVLKDLLAGCCLLRLKGLQLDCYFNKEVEGEKSCICFLQRQRISQEGKTEVDEKERGLIISA